MIRNISLIFSMLVLLILQKNFSDDLSITPVIPERVEPGSEFIVELKINKADVNGFAMLQVEIPDGFTASPIKNNNASFSFKDQKIKYIWIELPEEKEFTVSYKIKVDNSAYGSKSITGAFSYLHNSDKKVLSISESQVLVSTEALSQESKEDNDTETNELTDKSNNNVTNESGDNIPAETNNNGTEVYCKRTIDPNSISKEGFTVEVIINKKGIDEFAKLQEELPQGFVATAIETNGAQFTFTNQMVKFIWLNLPDQNEIKVAYKVNKETEVSGECLIKGEFAYVEKSGETKTFKLPQETVNIKPEEDLTAKAITPKTPAKTTETKQEKKQENQDKEKTLNPSPAPQSGGINYKVQIAAASKLLNPEYFTKKYGISEKIYTEMHGGMNKYTIGDFPNYSTARNNRESYISNYNINTGLFVTAYNNGQRITVQEALMISNQKWIK